MFVSVVIPTYNRAQFIERAVHSALSQTYSDLEVIVVDDASTDNTRDRIEALQQIDHRVRYLYHSINQGAQAARNIGIQASNGTYIAFLDSDNEWLPQKLYLQMELFSQKAGSLAVIYCGFRKVAGNGEIISEHMPKQRGNIYLLALRDWVADTSTLVVRKDILEKIHGFTDSVRVYQEWDLCIRLAREGEFDFVPECLVLYHQHTLPAISRDHLRNAHGYLDVVSEYHKEILYQCGKSTLSNHYLKAGKLFILANRFDLARASFMRSIQFYPLNIKALLYFGTSLFGFRSYKFLRKLRHILSSSFIID